MAVRIRGDLELKRKLDKIKDLRSIVPTLKAVSLHVKGKIATYPSDANAHRPQPFVSDKQRRFFFWALGKGIIEVPYRRGQSPGSEDHLQSWTIKSMKDGLKQVIGSDTSYGPLLQDAEKQTAYHRNSGWRTVQDIVETETDEALNFIKKAIDKILSR